MAFINYIKGDLFSHLPHTKDAVSIFAHSCNCQGAWGGGIAAVFKQKYPLAYKSYRDHCLALEDSRELLGTTYLCPTRSLEPGNKNRETPIYIACLFTSNFSESPEEIVEYTSRAMNDLDQQIKELQVQFEITTTDSKALVINLPKINSGIFRVPWEETEAVLKAMKDNIHFNVYVV
ncbi:ADP-ribose 1''-phosphate phosphatase [Scheffersomyces spartinae]|uniref:ADP-ribose 1''-phosphate phosphatase n=1 Tax=Scheffersomyces spartinae TaxID=45513 RepID=A0A9P7VCE9_9ASCO|nr:ADP-ribose 1''-phosphate phosphatase [Scheffersomyces spartinae]KAG7195243.1 ADP-ribose 1''-phosphate phosphatase [Scheffersomyces spartinae]